MAAALMERLLRLAALGRWKRAEIPVAAGECSDGSSVPGLGDSTKRRTARTPLRATPNWVAMRQAALLRGDWRFNGCTCW